jgi:hypothetical protein
MLNKLTLKCMNLVAPHELAESVLTASTNSWSRVLLENLVVTQLLTKFYIFYKTRRIIIVFTTACHWSYVPSIYVPLVWGTKFHTHTKTGEIIVLYTLSSSLWTGHSKTKYSELNDSKHSPNLICSSFLRECSFNLLLSFPNMWILPHFKDNVHIVINALRQQLEKCVLWRT